MRRYPSAHGHRRHLRRRDCAAPRGPPARASPRSTPPGRTRRCIAIADALEARIPEILEANARDMEAAARRGCPPPCSTACARRGPRARDRRQVRDIAALPDPVGEVIDGCRLANGLEVRQVRVPLGVVAVVYEARPNVTIDAAALCLKSGNAIVLRGSSSAAHSNAVLAAIAAERSAPEGAIGLVAGGGREELAELATQDGLVDLIIPRGGEGLKHALSAVATVPVIYAASGNCHVYVDARADLDAARDDHRQRQDPAPRRLQRGRDAARPRATPPRRSCPRALRALREGGRRAARRRPRARDRPRRAWREATRRGLGHRVPRAGARRRRGRLRRGGDRARQRARLRPLRGDRHRAPTPRPGPSSCGVDAACVYVNASTRFTDGGEFGMGAEIGNSTQKLHARGPIGMRELCTYKYVVEGDGHVRALTRAASASSGDVQPAAPRPPRVRAGGARPARAWTASC